MRYRFRDFEISDEPLELRRGGDVVDLQLKVLQVLLFLVRHADRMVEKEEIFEAVWPDVAVTEASLTRCISIIRRELGDDAVKTLRGRGYRMGVPVTTGEPSEAAPEVGVPRAPHRRWRVAAALVLLLAASFAWLGRPFAELAIPTGSDVVARRATDVAVLPLEVFGDPGGPQDLGHRIALEVVDQLLAVNELRVVPTASSFRVGREQSLAGIGRELSAGTLVVGSIRPSPQGIRAIVEVVEAETGYRHWSKPFEREGARWEQLPGEIAAQVAHVLGASIEGAVDYVSSPDLESARLSFEGRDALVREKRQHVMRAVELFERAIALDPKQPRAYVALGSAYERLWGYDDPGSTWLDRGETVARIALELVPGDPEALVVLGAILRDRKDWSGARAAFQAAIDAGPTGHAHGAMAGLLCMLGAVEEAVPHAEAALALSPTSGAAHFTAARVAYYRGRPEAAVAHLERAAVLEPHLTDLPTLLARAYQAAGREDEAREAFLLVSPRWFRPVLRTIDRTLGMQTSLRVVMWLDEIEQGARCPTRGMGRALVWAQLGESERMFECLDATARKNPWYLAVEPGFAPHRRDPRFAVVLAREGLAEPAASASAVPAAIR